MRPRISARDHLLGLAVSLAYLALLLATSRELGMSRDEGFYVEAAERYASWFERAWSDRSAAFERVVIDSHWTVNHEHPSLPKSLFALSWLAQRTYHVFPADSMAHRFPAMVMSSLLLWLIWIFGADLYGRRAGAFAAAAWALMPNVFYHSHLNCFDLPIVAMSTWVTYCYWRSLHDIRWTLLLGIAYGLALETKHNAWILPILFAVHWLAFVVPREIAARRAGHGRVAWIFPWWLVAMALLGPPIFVALWPWLWHDTLARFQEYAAFHLHHVHYNVAYLGKTYFGPPSPASFPWVMTLFTVPLVSIVMALAGMGVRARAMLPAWLGALWPVGETCSDRLASDALVFGSMLTPMVVLSLPWTPIFGGTKHFFGAWVYLAMFAGIAFDRVVRALRDAIRRVAPWVERSAPSLAAAMLLAPSALGTIRSHPFGPAYYGFAAGGVAGAADLGMMRQFWGFTTGSLVPWLNENVRENGRVWICDTVPTSWHMLQRDHRLRDDIHVAWDIGSADFAIVHHEDHFVEVDYQIWMHYGRVDPVYVLTYDGVPIISVYRNPR